MKFIPVSDEKFYRWLKGEEILPVRKRSIGAGLRSRNLTKAQVDVYQYLISFIASNGFSPSFDEIRANFGWKSKNAARDHVAAIERKGLISCAWGVPRSIVILDVREGAA
jgi:hypothetical protein